MQAGERAYGLFVRGQCVCWHGPALFLCGHAALPQQNKGGREREREHLAGGGGGGEAWVGGAATHKKVHARHRHRVVCVSGAKGVCVGGWRGLGWSVWLTRAMLTDEHHEDLFCVV